VSETSGINQAFLGLIVLPIAGNAAEHITVGWRAGGQGGQCSAVQCSGQAESLHLFI